MYLAYFDESGDDGFPKYSSPLFVLTCLYIEEEKWKENIEMMLAFRRALKSAYDFPVKQELHTAPFIQDKDPYHGKYSHEKRKYFLLTFAYMISCLDIQIVNVVIDKRNIKSSSYDVLGNAFKYCIQRIENDLIKKPDKRFMIISDEGRMKSMVRVARKIQKVNFIPSKYGIAPYRQEISCLIEDPLAKASDSSYFIQICDYVSYFITLYSLKHLAKVPTEWPKRVQRVLEEKDVIEILDVISGKFNQRASSKPYNIVYYPS